MGDDGSESTPSVIATRSAPVPRGFAALPPELRRELARRGGKTAHRNGNAHRFSSEEARRAGQRGGRAPRRRRTAAPDVRADNVNSG